jgi:hypothetical protein
VRSFSDEFEGANATLLKLPDVMFSLALAKAM